MVAAKGLTSKQNFAHTCACMFILIHRSFGRTALSTQYMCLPTSPI